MAYISRMIEYVAVRPDEPVARNGAIKLYGPDGFEGMRKAGRLAAEVLDALVPHVVPGVTTEELDTLVREHKLRGGGIPATLNYRGYTHSCCISINHVVCHGIPGPRQLKSGDIVNIDVTVMVDGWHGDTSRMFLVGDVPIKARRLVEVTYQAMMLGIEQAKPGNRLGDISHAIQSFAEKHRYGVVRDFCGHGLGRVFHDAPGGGHSGAMSGKTRKAAPRRPAAVAVHDDGNVNARRKFSFHNQIGLKGNSVMTNACFERRSG